MHAAEGKEWFQLELNGFIRLKDGEPDHHLFLVMNQQTLLPQNDIAHPVGHPRNILNIKILNIFMTLGTVIIAMVFADPGVETLAVADNRCIKRRQENIPVSSECVDGTDQQAVVLAGVTAHNCCTRITACPVGAQGLTTQRVLEVNYLSLIKFNISHNFRISVKLDKNYYFIPVK
jgi:hypothetical protein